MSAATEAAKRQGCLGYVVLTLQKDGSWRDDWDGELHVDAHDGVRAYSNAVKALGGDGVKLGRVTDFFVLGIGE